MCDQKKFDPKKERERLRWNGLKALKIANAVRANWAKGDEIEKYLDDFRSEPNREELKKYLRRLQTCSSYSVWRDHHESGAKIFCGVHTCNHKLCNVCNAMRSRVVRRKYHGFFEKNPDLLKQYTPLHLTLTVPHDLDGWDGSEFYAKRLKDAYQKMRLQKWWKEMVWGGEYGMEITRNDSGWHIHLHSLILVPRHIYRSRNILYSKIMLSWNRLTSDGSKVELSEDRKASLKGTVQNKVIEKLTATGSTLIGLESLYVTSMEERKGYKYCARRKKYIRYVNSKNMKDMMSGVMECIKYHFEPASLDMSPEELGRLLPLIKHMRFYDRFGGLSGRVKEPHPDAHMLALATTKDIEAEVNEVADDKVTDPITGKVLSSDQYDLIVVPMGHVFINRDNPERVYLHRVLRQFRHGTSLSDAHKYLVELVHPKPPDNKLEARLSAV